MKLNFRYKTAITLMAVSMVMLAAFQIFWLRKEFNEQKKNLITQSSLIFEQTIRNMEDSLILSKLNVAISLQKQPSDIIEFEGAKKIPENIISGRTQMAGAEKREGVLLHKLSTINIVGDDAVMIKHKGDSGLQRIQLNKTKMFLKDSSQLITIHANDSINQQSFSIKVIGDAGEEETKKRISKVILPLRNVMDKRTIPDDVFSPTDNKISRALSLDFDLPEISQDSLAHIFQKSLLASDIDLKIKVRQDTLSENDSTLINNPEIIKGKSTFNNKEYYATFISLNNYLIKKILPQLSFSLLLLGVTFVSFSFIYRSMVKQNKLNELKNDLISNISHELKTPISTVGVALEAMQNFSSQPLGEKESEYLDISRNELNKLSFMVDMILQSSVSGGTISAVSKEVIDLKELINDVLDSWKLTFDEKKINCLFNFEGNDFLMNGDKLSLTGVFNNLIDNSIKYGGKNVAIKINLIADENNLTIRFEDDGPGIPKEYRNMIFDKFFRVPTGNMHNFKGYGLGLNYVQNIVIGLGGKIHLVNTGDRGCAFHLIFNKINSATRG